MARVPGIVSAPGSRPYQLLLELGAGGMATVYLGRAVGAGGFQRDVAVKVCHDHLAKDAEFRAMFLDEARLAARIHHPNVIPTLDVGESRDLYLVMEYVEGDRLAHLAETLRDAGEPFPVDAALRIALDALAGLEAAHECTDAEGKNLGIVHRDAGAHNILVGADGIARISDFGIAKAISQSATTKEGHVKGKLGYMPPEYLHARDVGRFTDTYAMGVVLWELLTGERLFAGETEGQTVAAVLRGEVPPLEARRPDVPAPLAAVVRRALDRDPSSRFATAAGFAAALEGLGIRIASTREVAAFVQRVIGPELAARRAELRAMERAHEEAITPALSEAPSVTAGGRVGAQAQGDEAGRPATSGGAGPLEPTGSRRGPGVWAWVAGGVVLAAGALWWATRSDAPPQEVAAPTAAAPTNAAAAGVVDAARVTLGAGEAQVLPPPTPRETVDGAVPGAAAAAPSAEARGPEGAEPAGAARTKRARTGRNAVRSRTPRGTTRPKPKAEWQPKDI